MLHSKRAYRAREFQYKLFLLPALAIYIVFFLFPVLSTVWYSFTDMKFSTEGIGFIGLANYVELFTGTSRFLTALGNNVYFTLVVTVLQSAFAFILALALDAPLRGKGFFKTYFFAPVVITSVAVSLIWSFMYDPNTGVINTLLQRAGLGVLQQNWLGNKDIAMFSIAMVQIWQWVGFEMVIFIAGLNTIPKEMYEVAKIEGANYLQTLRHVILPGVSTSAIMAVVLTTIGCFKVFDTVYIMTGGGPVYSTEVLAKMVYDYGFKFSRMGFASAISVVLLGIIMVIGFAQIWLLRDKD